EAIRQFFLTQRDAPSRVGKIPSRSTPSKSTTNNPPPLATTLPLSVIPDASGTQQPVARLPLHRAVLLLQTARRLKESPPTTSTPKSHVAATTSVPPPPPPPPP